MFSFTYLRASHYEYPPDDFYVTKNKTNFIRIHFHTVSLKPQSKAFHHTLNFINYL